MREDGLMGLFFAFFNSLHQIIYFCPIFNQWEPILLTSVCFSIFLSTCLLLVQQDVSDLFVLYVTQS